MSTGSQGEGSSKAQASQAPCLRKKGGIEGDDDRGGLGGHPGSSHCVSSFPNTNPQQCHLFSVKLGARRKKGRKQHERKGHQPWLPDHKGRLQTENKLPQPRARAKKRGTAGDGDREGLGWPPREITLRFVLPQHQRNKDPKKREKPNNTPSRCPLTRKRSNKAPNRKASHLFTPSHLHVRNNTLSSFTT